MVDVVVVLSSADWRDTVALASSFDVRDATGLTIGATLTSQPRQAPRE